MRRNLNSEKRYIVNELHKPARKNFPRRRVIINGIDDLWQTDLVEMGVYSSDNDDHRYMLTIIDEFSKYAWVVPFKSKTGAEVTEAMHNIFKKGRSPKNLQTDAGKEFFNKQFRNLVRKYHVNHYSTYSVLKGSIVERFYRTLKTMMWKEFCANGSYRWIHLLQSLVKAYNNRTYRTIKMLPSEVNHKNEKQLLKTAYNHLKIISPAKFKIGDQMRISKFKHLFEKGYIPNWTTEVFKISTVQNTNPVTYFLEDYQGHPIEGGYYEKDLMKTKFPNTFLIEKVVRQSSKHNSWIDKP